MTQAPTLTQPLALLGVWLPEWPAEPEHEANKNAWIERGLAYAEVLRLWRAQLRNAAPSTLAVVHQLVEHLAQRKELAVWDRLAVVAIAPEVESTPEYERWQVITKLIRSSALTPAQLLGASVELAREQRLAAAVYGVKRLVQEQSLAASERLQLVGLMIEAINTAKLMKEASGAHAAWKTSLAIHEGFTHLMKAALGEAEELKCSMDRISNILGEKGAHGHAIFIEICRQRLPRLLERWDGPRPWLIEVGCSREIIEGQNSTPQLLTLAQQLDLPFAGIDLDAEIIEALKRDYSDFDASWITGKGEDELRSWEQPIAAIYLDAYDFVHASHSDHRQQSYISQYGTPINDDECHRMHLLAAQHAGERVLIGGLLGLDDTWRDGEGWAGKGAKALPWLMDHGWQLVSESNRSTVLCRGDVDL